VHRPERVRERDLGDLDAAAGVPVLEGGDGGEQAVVGRALEPDAQRAGDRPGLGTGLLDRGAQRAVGRFEGLPEPLTERREADAAAGAADQPGTHAPFEGADQLAHPALRDVEPLPRPPEVQLVGEDEETLELPDLQPGHHATSGR
jgi:hypothetical protein